MEDEHEPDINDQIEQRRRSLEQIIQLGFDPYPHKFDRTHSISQIVRHFSAKTGEELEIERPRARVPPARPNRDRHSHPSFPSLQVKK